MVSKIDILIYNLIAFGCFAAVLFFQYSEAVSYVDVFGNLFK